MRINKNIFILLILFGFIFSGSFNLVTDSIITSDPKYSNNSDSLSLFLYGMWLQNDKFNNVPSFSCRFDEIIPIDENKVKINDVVYMHPGWVHSSNINDEFISNEYVTVFVLFNTLLSIQKNTNHEFVLDNNSLKYIINKSNLDTTKLRNDILLKIKEGSIPLEIRNNSKEYTINPTREKWCAGCPDWINMKNGITSVAASMTVLAIKNYISSGNNWSTHKEVFDSDATVYYYEQYQSDLTLGVAFNVGSVIFWIWQANVE